MNKRLEMPVMSQNEKKKKIYLHKATTQQQSGVLIKGCHVLFIFKMKGNFSVI